jgi:rubredoxin
VAQRRYAERVGVPFNDVQCVRGFVAFRTRQEVWHWFGRMKALREGAKILGWSIGQPVPYTNRYGYGYNSQGYGNHEVHRVHVVDRHGQPVSHRHINSVAPERIPDNWYCPQADSRGWVEVDEQQAHDRVLFCREF